MREKENQWAHSRDDLCVVRSDLRRRWVIRSPSPLGFQLSSSIFGVKEGEQSTTLHTKGSMGVSGRFSSVHRRFGRSEFTVYVDNLPNSCGTPWFRLVFSQYGFIDETFLPNRRSKRTGIRFGFVRFRNRRDAASAVAMANGLPFGSRSIIVEMARYDSGLMRGDSTRFGSGSQNHEFSRVPNAKIPHIQDDFRAPRGKPKSIPIPQHHFHTESSQIPNMGNLKELESKVTLQRSKEQGEMQYVPIRDLNP